MDETIEYIGERYPDLTDGDLTGLHEIGIRFCKPAIAHGDRHSARKQEESPVALEDAPVAVEDAPVALDDVPVG